MDDFQAPQSQNNFSPQPESNGEPVAPTPQPAPVAQPVAPLAPTVSEPRNFFATFLLASYGGILGLRHFYLGQKTLGFVRLGLFLAYFVLLVLGGLAQSGVIIMLGIFSALVAYIWAIVDYFVVYLSVKTDAEGQALTRTERDSKWAKVMFIITIVVTVTFFVLGVGFALFAESSFKSITNRSNNTRNNSLDSRYRYDSGSGSSLDSYRYDY